jgi:DegV family protein with EDD domain
MSTAIVTDTNSGIYEKQAAELGIHVVPMPVIIGEETYFEGVNITQEEFFDALLSNQQVMTSQPSPEDVTGTWDRVLEEYDDLVYIPMSSGLSGSCQTARILAEDYNGRVQVADNHRISLTMRHAIEDAQVMIKNGMNAAQVKNVLEQTAFDSVVFLGLETLTFLKRGGRITPAGAAIGSILNIKPLTVIRGEKLDKFATVRGTKACRKKEVEALAGEVEKMKARGLHVKVDTAGSFLHQEDAEAWREMVQEAFPDQNVRYNPLSLSISVHTGPDSYGCAASILYER